MQVSVETTNGLERKATITVPAASFEELVAERVKSAASDLKLPGFRPGKVPLKEVRRRFGTALRQEVASELSKSTFVDAISEEDLSLAGQATIEIVSMERGRDLEYTATFEILPKVELVDLAMLKVGEPEAEIEEADIDATVESLREQRVEWRPVERPATLRDRVSMDLAFRVGGELTSEPTRDFSIVLGREGLLEDLQDALIGAVAGETRTFRLASDDREDAYRDEGQGHDSDDGSPVATDEPAADLTPDTVDEASLAQDAEENSGEPSAGEREGPAPRTKEPSAGEREGPAPRTKEPSAGEREGPAPAADDTPTVDEPTMGEATVNAVEEPLLPEVDDEFMEWYGVESGDDRPARFRAAVRERMELELAAAKRRAARREVHTALIKAHDFEVPKALVFAEHQDAVNRRPELYRDAPDELLAAALVVARRSVAAQLVMREIAVRESVQVDDERVRRRIDEIADSYEESAEVRRFLYGDEEQLQGVERSVLEEQVVDLVLSRSQRVSVPMSYQDVVAGVPMPTLEDSPAETADEAEDADPLPAETADAEATAEPQAEKPKRGLFRRLFGR